MELQTIGVPMAFADLKPGTFFMFWGKERAFALKVTGGTKSAAMMFYEREHRKGSPWFAEGGLPTQVLAFPTAVIRPTLSSASLASASTVGVLVDDGNRALITCHSDADGYLTFDAKSGMHQDGPEGLSAIAYGQWEIGVILDGKFSPIFTFPKA